MKAKRVTDKEALEALDKLKRFLTVPHGLDKLRGNACQESRRFSVEVEDWLHDEDYNFE